MSKKVAFAISHEFNFSLAASYQRAFDYLGWETKNFPIAAYQNKYIKLGKFGQKLHNFLPITEWIRKANRDLVIDLKNYQPDLLIILGKTKIQLGAVAFIKSISKCKVLVIWPDTLCNIEQFTLDSARISDALGTYSSNSIEIFKEIGFKNPFWLPLGADEFLHKIDKQPENFSCDLSFIGGWRPERETALSSIKKHFPKINLKIFGNYWDRDCQDKDLKPHLTNKSITGRAYAEALNQSRINLNVIDDTNYPSANMRFFEVPIAHGLQLSSPCPEQEGIYKDREHLLYFGNEERLLEQVEFVLSNPNKAKAIRQAAFDLTLKSNTYTNRSAQIIKYFEL